MHLGRQVFQQKGKGIVNRPGVNNVVVVKDKHEIIWDGGDFIEQSRQNGFGWRRLRGLEHTQHAFANMSAQSSVKQRRGKSESGEVVISFVQRQPGHGALAAGDHSLTSVVLPKPAGAEMRVSLRCRPAFNRSIRRGRRTTLAEAGGYKV